jgi:hypothetical protein
VGKDLGVTEDAGYSDIDAENLAESGLEVVESEVLDEQASLPTFEILTYPADYTLEVLVDKWRKKQLVIPNFQRRFVWTQVQSSKLIESFILGLPVPPIFLYSEPETGGLLVVDGQQRLRTIVNYYDGYFGEEVKGSRAVFRLVGLDSRSPYLGKTYEDLGITDPAVRLRLDDSVLRAFVVKQLNPADNTSIYHIFERLNTGGTFLNPQEVRNCVRHGALNDALKDFNSYPDWRNVFGKQLPDKRLRDVELILRFLALHYNSESYTKPMKDFLNRFMDLNRNPGQGKLAEFRNIFESTSTAVYETLGSRPFHVRQGLNAAVFDSVFTAYAASDGRASSDVQARYQELLRIPEYIATIGSGTTDEEIVRTRLRLARDTLFSHDSS